MSKIPSTPLSSSYSSSIKFDIKSLSSIPFSPSKFSSINLLEKNITPGKVLLKKKELTDLYNYIDNIIKKSIQEFNSNILLHNKEIGSHDELSNISKILNITREKEVYFLNNTLDLINYIYPICKDALKIIISNISLQNKDLSKILERIDDILTLIVGSNNEDNATTLEFDSLLSISHHFSSELLIQRDIGAALYSQICKLKGDMVKYAKDNEELVDKNQKNEKELHTAKINLDAAEFNLESERAQFDLMKSEWQRQKDYFEIKISQMQTDYDDLLDKHQMKIAEFDEINLNLIVPEFKAPSPAKFEQLSINTEFKDCADATTNTDDLNFNSFDFPNSPKLERVSTLKSASSRNAMNLDPNSSLNTPKNNRNSLAVSAVDKRHSKQQSIDNLLNMILDTKNGSLEHPNRDNSHSPNRMSTKFNKRVDLSTPLIMSPTKKTTHQDEALNIINKRANDLIEKYNKNIAMVTELKNEIISFEKEDDTILESEKLNFHLLLSLAGILGLKHYVNSGLPKAPSSFRSSRSSNRPLNFKSTINIPIGEIPESNDESLYSPKSFDAPNNIEPLCSEQSKIVLSLKSLPRPLNFNIPIIPVTTIVKWIRSTYKTLDANDDLNSTFTKLKKLSFPDILYYINRTKYGLANLSDQKLWSMLVSANYSRSENEEIELFCQFIEERRSKRELDRFLAFRTVADQSYIGLRYPSATESDIIHEYFCLNRCIDIVNQLFAMYPIAIKRLVDKINAEISPWNTVDISHKQLKFINHTLEKQEKVLLRSKNAFNDHVVVLKNNTDVNISRAAPILPLSAKFNIADKEDNFFLPNIFPDSNHENTSVNIGLSSKCLLYSKFQWMVINEFQLTELENSLHSWCKELFEVVDINADGKINLEEFTEILSFLRPTKSEKDVEELFQKCINENEINDNLQITFKSFCKLSKHLITNGYSFSNIKMPDIVRKSLIVLDS